MNVQRDIVITGLGVVSPIGIGREAFRQSLLTGKGGVVRLHRGGGLHPALTMGGAVSDFDPKQHVQPRKIIKVMSRPLQLGFAAARLAMEDAGLSGKVEPDRLGVVLGSELFYSEMSDLEAAFRRTSEAGRFDFDRWPTDGMGQIQPLWLLKQLPNMAACHIGIAHDARGHNNSLILGGVSSLLSVIEAATVIERGDADAMMAGGAGSRIDLGPMIFRGLAGFSTEAEQPSRACRPFDLGRSGVVGGEGAGVVILESRAHAAARGAAILASLRGWCSAFSSAPRNGAPQDAIGAVLRGALHRAALSAADVGHVNAHGASSISGDADESAAIRESLGDVPVTAPKSHFGDLGAGSGLVEMAASLLALEEQTVPPTLNYEQPDPRCPVRVIAGRPQPAVHQTALCLNYSDTGQAAAVLIEVHSK